MSIRESLRPTNVRPFPTAIVSTRTLGRYGYSLMITNVRDQYGHIGSQGYTISLNVWKNR